MTKSNQQPNNNVLVFIQSLHTEGFQEHCVAQYYKFTGLPSDGSKSINVGYVHLFENIKFLIFFMENWTNFIDEKLLAFKEGTDDYADIMGLRGFTLSEFKLVLSSKLNEEFFGRHKVFDYLFLTDSADRDFFSVANVDDEDEVFDSYARAIRSAINLEITPLKFFFSKKVPLYYPISSFKRGTYMVGQSGSGKSTLLKLLIYDLQRRSQKYRNRSIVLIEPSGDLCLEVVSFALNRKEYWKRMVYLNPFLRQTAIDIFGYDLLGAEYTFSINPFQVRKNITDQEINYLTEELGSAIFQIAANEPTAQMEVVIEACVETLLRREGSDISDLKKMVNEAENEEYLTMMETIPNEERSKMAERMRNDKNLRSSLRGVFYRLQKILGNSDFKRLLTGKNTVNIEKFINDGRCIIFDVSKTKLGKNASPAFGKLMLSLIQGYAKKRQDIPVEKRKETFVIADEFQNYTVDSVHEIAEESRKFALHLMLSQQYIGQGMDNDMKRSITSNTALKIASDNDADSLKFMSENMGNLSPKNFEKLPPYSFYVYDKHNKKAGIQMVRVPDFLVDLESKFYQTREELEEYFLWLANDSGYYRKVENKPRGSSVEESPLPTSSLSKDIYNPEFDD